MSRKLLIVSDYLARDLPWDLPAPYEPAGLSLHGGIPDLAELKGYDTVVILGQLANEGSAIQFGGALRLGVEAGLTVLLMYPVHVGNSDKRLIEQLLPEVSSVTTYGGEWSVVTDLPPFHEYFAVYGRAGTVIRPPTSNVRIIGRIESDPCALAVPRGSGHVYLVPFHVADMGTSYNSVVASLLQAVEEDRGEITTESLPAFLGDLRLPGEDELLSSIEEMEEEMNAKRTEAERLQAFRHLIGMASGSWLETLTIEALNAILDGTDIAAEDREDVGAEDFWLIRRSEGDSPAEVNEDQIPKRNFALAEVKGVGGHVRRANVNQVDDHRDAHDLQPDEMPGLLIVNVFRNSSGGDATQRTLPVNADVVLHAARNNVLVLRTWDLFYLLHRKLAGENAGMKLLEALQGGGGWLEVDEQTVRLRTS